MRPSGSNAALAPCNAWRTCAGTSEALPLQAMNVVAIVAMHSPTLRATLSSTVRYQTLVSNSGRFDLRPVAGGLRLYYQVTPCPVPMHPAQIDSVFAGYWSLLRRCSPPGTCPTRMGLPGTDPTQRSAYEAFFGCAVELGVERGYAEFDDATLDRAHCGADPDLLRLAIDRADAMRAEQDHSDALVDHVQATVTALGFAGVECAQVARELGMSTRSLQRRLAESGTTFRKLTEAARMDEALRLLADDTLPVARISNRLGFSEPSALSHAVRDYWGASPRVLRREFARRGGALT
jgi:AraC-like DNA-binding protein